MRMWRAASNSPRANRFGTLDWKKRQPLGVNGTVHVSRIILVIFLDRWYVTDVTDKVHVARIIHVIFLDR